MGDPGRRTAAAMVAMKNVITGIIKGIKPRSGVFHTIFNHLVVV
jgi:hypothetical protein